MFVDVLDVCVLRLFENNWKRGVVQDRPCVASRKRVLGLLEKYEALGVILGIKLTFVGEQVRQRWRGATGYFGDCLANTHGIE